MRTSGEPKTWVSSDSPHVGEVRCPSLDVSLKVRAFLTNARCSAGTLPERDFRPLHEFMRLWRKPRAFAPPSQLAGWTAHRPPM